MQVSMSRNSTATGHDCDRHSRNRSKPMRKSIEWHHSHAKWPLPRPRFGAILTLVEDMIIIITRLMAILCCKMAPLPTKIATSKRQDSVFNFFFVVSTYTILLCLSSFNSSHDAQSAVQQYNMRRPWPCSCISMRTFCMLSAGVVP